MLFSYYGLKTNAKKNLKVKTTNIFCFTFYSMKLYMSRHLQIWYTIMLLFWFEIGLSWEPYIRINKSATKEMISAPEELWVIHICWKRQFILLYACVGMRFKRSLGCNVDFSPCPNGNIFLHLSVHVVFMDVLSSVLGSKVRFSLCLYSVWELYKAKLSMLKSKVVFFFFYFWNICYIKGDCIIDQNRWQLILPF